MNKELVAKQIYVLIAIVIIFVGIIVWRYLAPSHRLEQAASQIAEIAHDLRAAYRQKVDYWKLDTKFAVDNNMLTNLSYNGGKLLNALGKEVLIGRGKDGDTLMPGERSFDIVYKNLSLAECVILSTYQYKQKEELGLLQITIISNDKSQNFDWGEGDFGLPINRETAKKFCTNNSTVLWTME